MIGNVFQGVDASESIEITSLVGDFKQGDQLQIVKMVDTEDIFDFDAYTYYDEDNYWLVFLDEAGWADESGFSPEGVTLDLGRGAYFITDSGDGQWTQMSGQVKGGAHTHVFDDQYTIMCSAYPVEFDPNDARMDWSVPNGAQIQVVKMVDTEDIFDFDAYTYYDEDNYWLVFLDEAGWADESGFAPEGAIAGPGDAFYMILPDGEDPQDAGLVESSPIAAAE